MAIANAKLDTSQLKWLKALLFIAALLPLGRLALLAFIDQLGANPVEFIIRNSGDWALYFICITLAITPLRRVSGWNWLTRLRRMIGLFTFFYASLHFLAFLWLDHFFDIPELLDDVIKRPFITVGFTAFLLLVPMTLTSTNAMIKWLGSKRWQWLHRLIYLIGPLGILHYWWIKVGKNNFYEPVLFGIVVAALLLIRMYWWLSQRRDASTPVAP